MPENGEERAARRVDQLISDLQAGRRLRAKPEDAAELREILTAASFQGAQETSVGMSASFRRRIASMMREQRHPRPLSRRAALVAGLTAAGGVATGAALGRLSAHSAPPQTASTPAAAPPAPTIGPPVLVPLPQSARWVDVGIAAADLREGEPRRVSAGSVAVFVVRKGEDVLALSAICTHQPCELLWRPEAASLACPCHNQAFDLAGHPMASSYVLPPLPMAKVRIRAGRIEVLGT